MTPRLLAADEPPPVEIVNADGGAPEDRPQRAHSFQSDRVIEGQCLLLGLVWRRDPRAG